MNGTARSTGCSTVDGLQHGRVVQAGLVLEPARRVLPREQCRYILAFPPIVALGHDDLVASVGAVVQRYLIDDFVPIQQQQAVT
ncbi:MULTISPECIES: hypothetical protein [unclassified Microbacterium]|uniref:hypothetical protein n=1 Tax=unclassified Microbacterium TaxID=2609290 RepID=UPI00214B0CCF|nr:MULTISPECIES: hypothetical protein [unclassified Microbacterium]MCR2783937.1 hypothetical protein [Microbacterium sp. zg.B96]WIM15219.1 hypothetical protein QNO11_11795 [Microbacterium sp. zg-B96]